MKNALVAVILLLGIASPAFAHRLDEYLQASTFTLERDHVSLQMRLTPGVEVINSVLANIDTNGDGAISESEQQNYAKKVLADLAVAVDHHPVELRLTSSTFPPLAEMKEGTGEILLNLTADLSPGGSTRTVSFQNHHLSGISVYLANVLVPHDPGIRVTAQSRNYDQSSYELEYAVADSSSTAPAAPSTAAAGGWSGETGGPSLFKAFFYFGVRHILTGYDHLLFVSALVLAATTLWDLVKVVSAFTIAHTITLTLAAMNVVHLPGWVVEPLISASIVFVALQNVFWPRRARGWSRLAAAFFFGLFHGLGFAGGLLDAMREMQNGTMFLAIIAFSVGVETGHQLVVLPLFGLLKGARRMQPDVVKRVDVSLRLQRLGSAVISVAGGYYLCLAIFNK